MPSEVKKPPHNKFQDVQAASCQTLIFEKKNGVFQEIWELIVKVIDAVKSIFFMLFPALRNDVTNIKIVYKPDPSVVAWGKISPKLAQIGRWPLRLEREGFSTTTIGIKEINYAETKGKITPPFSLCAGGEVLLPKVRVKLNAWQLQMLPQPIRDFLEGDAEGYITLYDDTHEDFCREFHMELNKQSEVGCFYHVGFVRQMGCTLPLGHMARPFSTGLTPRINILHHLPETVLCLIANDGDKKYFQLFILNRDSEDLRSIAESNTARKLIEVLKRSKSFPLINNFFIKFPRKPDLFLRANV